MDKNNGEVQDYKPSNWWDLKKSVLLFSEVNRYKFELR